MIREACGLVLVLLLGSAPAPAAERSVRVFVALCDNQTQGIVPAGKRIGNGDDPEANLYWGCDDGLASWFRRGRTYARNQGLPVRAATSVFVALD